MKKFILLPALLLFCIVSSYSQGINNAIPYFTYSKGFGVTAPDSMYSLNIRFRIQNRIGATTSGDEADELHVKEWEAVVRRLRLRFDGYVYSPKLTYVLQLSLSRSDMDWDNTNFPNVIRDAMVIYRVNKYFAMGMGQTKLPGNRQRINSSGDLQFADRSPVNATFNIDRDFGVQFYHDNSLGQTFQYTLRGAISSGEGRNIGKTDEGLGYSTRLELYPLGAFTNGGDYFESDLAREKKPKLSVAGFYFYNDRGTKNGGTIGKPLFEERSFSNYGADMMLKYKGWALTSEFVKRDASNPVTFSSTTGEVSYIYAGMGSNTELSYLFKNNFEIGGRCSMLRPTGQVRTGGYEHDTDYYTLGVTKYLRGHRLKVQSDLTYKNVITNTDANNWQLRLQVEIGI